MTISSQNAALGLGQTGAQRVYDQFLSGLFSVQTLTTGGSNNRGTAEAERERGGSVLCGGSSRAHLSRIF